MEAAAGASAPVGRSLSSAHAECRDQHSEEQRGPPLLRLAKETFVRIGPKYQKAKAYPLSLASRSWG